MSSLSTNVDLSKDLRHIPLSYNNADSQTSALRLVLTLFPQWEHDEGRIEFVRFTDGITNTVRSTTGKMPNGYYESKLILYLALESCEAEAWIY